MPAVRLPRILETATRRLSLDVDGTTMGDALDDLLDQEPALRVHLFNEAGALRPHVMCFVDGAPTRLEDPRQSVAPTSTIVFVQAVSGG